MDQKLVCISGQIESGKDAMATYLTKQLNRIEPIDSYRRWRQVAFGDAVKRVLSKNFGISREFIEEWKRKDEAPPGFDMTIRKALMWIGDGFRQIRASIWIDKLFEENQPLDGHLVISDGRYVSEVDAVRERGGINIAIYRPGHANDIKHPSESQLKPFMDDLVCRYKRSGKVTISPFDFFVINNGSLDDLYDDLGELLIPFIREKLDQET